MKEKGQDNVALQTVAESKELATAVANPLSLESIESMMAFGEMIVKSKFSPLQKAEDVVAAVLMGKAVGLDPIVAVNNIHPIEGKASMGIHAITGLALKAGVTYEVNEDYTPLYAYRDRDDAKYPESDVTKRKDLFQIVTSTTPATELKKDMVHVMFIPQSIDRRTTVRFTRKVGDKILTVIVDRNLSDFANLMTKSNWANNPRTMLMNRILAIGFRMIADDILNGMYDHDELNDMREGNQSVPDAERVTIIETPVVNATYHEGHDEITPTEVVN